MPTLEACSLGNRDATASGAPTGSAYALIGLAARLPSAAHPTLCTLAKLTDGINPAAVSTCVCNVPAELLCRFGFPVSGVFCNRVVSLGPRGEPLSLRPPASTS